MARPKKGGGGEPDINFSGVHKIWDALTFDDWLTFLAEHKPASKFTRNKAHIMGSCPFHEGDETASFMVSPNKGLVKCFGGTCGKVYTNPIRFVAAILGANYGDTLIYLKKRYGLKGILPESLIKHYQDYYTHQNHKKALCAALRTLLVDAALDRDNPYNMYAKPLLDWLIDVRGIDPTYIDQLGIGVIPPLLYLAKAMGGEDSPDCRWAREYLSTIYDGSANVGSLVFFMYDEPDNIARLKLRKPATKDIRWVDDRYDEAQGKFRGFYGMHYYASLFGMGEFETPVITAKSVYLVEGEFDAMKAICEQIKSGNLDAIWLALGGKGAQMNEMDGLGGLDRLISLGIETINIVRDRDDGGYGFVQQILKQITSDEVNVRIMNWPEFEGEEHVPEDQRINDPDEWIKLKGYESFSKYARTFDHYQQPHVWAYDNAAEAMEKLPADDVKRKAAEAMNWGKLLKSRLECGEFCKAIGRAFDMDPVILDREINARDEDEDGFVRRIMETLKEHFHFVGIEGIEGHKRRMELWDKKTRTSCYIVLNDGRSVETALAMFFGSLPDFIRDYIGDPQWTTNEGETSKMSLRARTEMYRDYVNIAVLKASKGLDDLRTIPRKSQGLHYMGQNDQDGFLAYMINGRDGYRISYPNKMVVTPLDGPKDKNVVFKFDPNRTWLPSVKVIQDILNGAGVDLQQLWKDVHQMISIAWHWKYPLLDAMCLAGYLFCLPVMSIFSRQTAIMVNGEAQSGKSRFTGGLIGGAEYERIRIIAASHAMEGFTPASIRQEMDGCSLCLCLSEFEDYGISDKKSLNVRGVLEMERDMLSEGGVRISIGTTSGNPRTYWLRHALICSAIRPLRDEASLSRFITFELPKEGERKDPVLVLLDAFGQKRINEIRHQLAVGLIPHLPTLWRMNREIEQEYATGVSLPAHIPSRFRESLHPILTMMKFLGLDYKKFAFDFCEKRQEQLARVSTTSENEQIFETVLSSPFDIKYDNKRVSGKTTVRSMLALPRHEIQEMNMTRCGVYFDNETGWLTVHWIEALQGVLSNSTKYGHEASSAYLKEVSQRSPFHVPSEMVKQQRVLDRIKNWTGPGIQMSQVSVFDVRHLLEDAKNMIVPPSAQTGKAADEKKATAAAEAAAKEAAKEGIPDPAAENEVQGDDEFKV